MAKKHKGLELSTVYALGAIVTALVAFFLMFAPAASNSGGSFTGAQMAFGYSESGEVLGSTVTVHILNFSFMNFLPYLLLLIGMAFSGLAAFGKLSKIAPFIAAACYLVAGVFLFCVIPFCSPSVNTSIGGIDDNYIKNFKDALSLGTGAIVAGIFALLSALCSVCPFFIKMITKK